MSWLYQPQSPLSPGGRIATLTGTLGALTSASTATVSVQAQAAPTLGAATASSTATVAIQAQTTATLGGLQLNAQANSAGVLAQLTQTLAPAALTAVGNSLGTTAQLTSTLGGLGIAAAAVRIRPYRRNYIGQATTRRAAAGRVTTAQLQSTLGASTSSSTSTALVQASANVNLGAATLVSAVQGVPILNASLTQTLGAASIASTFISIPAVPLDGPGSLIKVPSQAAHFPAVNAAIPTPSFYWQDQTTPSDLIDSLNDVHMVQNPVDTLGTYGNTIAGWSTKFLGMTEVAAQNWQAAQLTAWNVFTQSVFIYMLCRFTSSSGTRRWYAVNGVTHYIEMLTNGHLRLDGGTTGTIDHRGANVIGVAVEMIAGAGVMAHTGPGLYRVSTNLEQITGTWSWVPDDFKGPGATGVAAPPVCNIGPQAVWVGTDAETCSTLGPKPFLQSFGHSVIF